ncbi:hypothetical protein B9J78_02080 [bacterium Unc6]|nr:hypothetical protein [bacterium Unc6]
MKSTFISLVLFFFGCFCTSFAQETPPAIEPLPVVIEESAPNRYWGKVSAENPLRMWQGEVIKETSQYIVLLFKNGRRSGKVLKSDIISFSKKPLQEVIAARAKAEEQRLPPDVFPGMPPGTFPGMPPGTFPGMPHMPQPRR